MTSRVPILFGAALLLAARGSGRAPVGNEATPPAAFPVASVHFEQNATDGDVEVVFEVKGGAEGLAQLMVVSPDGRTVLSLEAPDASSTLGLRQFRFESPEPRDVASLKAAYPEGVYTFAGWTAGGDTLTGESTLSHRLPATTSFLRPKAGARGVATTPLHITWTPVDNVAAYLVKIEQDELGENIAARLPATRAGFVVPDGFLRPATEYQLGIGTVTAEGNTSFVETTFTTAGKK
jgi:hypothetical protein